MAVGRSVKEREQSMRGPQWGEAVWHAHLSSPPFEPLYHQSMIKDSE